MGVFKREGEYSWIRYFHQRINQNKNVLVTVSGPTGSGKTWTAGSVCKLADPDHTIDNCVFRAKELMELINSGKLKRGSAILFDEAGIEMNARRWNTVTNRMLNYLIQTFRHKNFILIFTSPYIDFVDSATRKLFHAEFTTMNIDYKEETCMIKPKLIQYNSRYGKFYYKYLRTLVKGRGYIPIKSWNVPKPNKEWIEKYEIKKKEFTEELNARIMADLIKESEKSMPKRQYIHECRWCGYKWQSDKEKPPYQCVNPHCKRVLNPKKEQNA